VGGSSDNWPPDDWGDLWDPDEGPGTMVWTVLVILLAVILILGFWFWVDYDHRNAEAPPSTSNQLSSIFSFGATFDDSAPAHNFWQWDLTDHVNRTGDSLDLGDMVWTVSGSASGSVTNLTAFDTAFGATAAVWAFTGAWQYMPSYGSDTQVENQFIFLLNGSQNLDGVTVTLSCPANGPYSGSVSVTVSG
jgi:hypothetical protein